MNVNKVELLSSKQKKEFDLVILTQKTIKKKLIVQGFDNSIDVNIKLKPKFFLHPVIDRDFTSNTVIAKSIPLTTRQRNLNSPLISLVIPVYNRDSYLRATINSILSQTYTDFELIVWDDGSTDDSLAIATEYAREDSRIKVFTASNTGQGTALVKAIAFTNGKYLGTVDSDDLLHPEALAKTLAVLESNPGVGMVYTDHVVIDSQGKEKGIGKRCSIPYSPERLLIRCSIPYSPERLLIDFMTFHFRLIRRDVYDAVGGFDPTLGIAEDYDLCLRLSEVSAIEHLAEPLYYYRWHSANISTTQQLKQAKCSTIAVNRALQRRGLSQKLRLEVKLNPSYKLQRQSKVANKVFGIGLSKTGTTSLNDALSLLGIPSIHFPSSLEQVQEFDGATDTPIALAYEKLDLLYPGSKFILTIREPSSWLLSSQKHQQKVTEMFNGQISEWMIDLYTQCYGQWEYNSSLWLSTYKRHLQSVLKYFQGRESDLLILNICQGEGWKELCTFLGCSIPNSPFPHQNKKVFDF